MGRARAKRPSRDDNRVRERGVEALAIAREDQARLEARLPAAMIDGLASDLEAFGELVPGALARRAQTRGATAGQNTAAASAARLTAAIRSSVAAAGFDAGARKAWGVGQKVHKRIVKSVRAAGEVILARAAAAPGEARDAGVLPRDLEALAGALTALSGADAVQEDRKVGAKGATAARNAAGRRIEKATRRIAAAGELEFADEPARAARYATLFRAPRRRRRAPAPVPPT